MAIGPEQQKALFRAKLTSLVRLHFSDEPVTGSTDDRFDPDADDFAIGGFAHGAHAIQGDRAVVLLDSAGADGIEGLLGHALIGVRHCATVHLVLDADAGGGVALIARRAAAVATIASQWNVVGTELHPVEVPRSSPPPPADIPVGDPLVELLHREHLDVLVEDGTVVGELLGVEVARIVIGPDGEPRLDVGVGEYDQAAFAMMNANLDPTAGLTAVCAEVRKHRAIGAEPHPINRLARERWLRAMLMNNPAAVGLDRLSPVPSLRPRAGIKDEQPAVAIGTNPEGQMIGVVCAVGLDLDLVPTAADAIITYGLDAVTLVIPARDHYPLVDEMAALLNVPVQIWEAEEPWPAPLGGS